MNLEVTYGYIVWSKNLNVIADLIFL